jgi:predicted small secreted protein
MVLGQSRLSFIVIIPAPREEFDFATLRLSGNINQTTKGKMKTLTKSIICLFLLTAGMIVLQGCHTAHGFGEDMENAGDTIQQKTQ